jgi:hypothetical protein
MSRELNDPKIRQTVQRRKKEKCRDAQKKEGKKVRKKCRQKTKILATKRVHHLRLL